MFTTDVLCIDDGGTYILGPMGNRVYVEVACDIQTRQLFGVARNARNYWHGLAKAVTASLQGFPNKQPTWQGKPLSFHLRWEVVEYFNGDISKAIQWSANLENKVSNA